MEPYQDKTKNVDIRVKDLIARMTLGEKLAQLGAVWTYELMADRKFCAEKAEELIKDGIGHLSRGGVGTGLPPREIAEFVNDAQKYLMENTRLGIPVLVHEECLNGFMARGATIFPQIIGMASTWEPELVAKMSEVARKHMLAVGVRQGLSPVLDVARDPRWGRVEETYGEDPYLVATMGVAYIKGLQGDDISQGIVATPKHFVGYGKSEGGLNWAPADIPPRMLREVYLYPFERAIKEAGALSLMNAYHELDGIPCGASVELLTKILHDEWKFQGIVISDYYAIESLQNYHRVAADAASAGKLALTAGIDAELPKTNCYGAPLKEQVEEGLVPMELVDRALARVLKLKFMLGLFEKPYVNPQGTAKVFDLPEFRQLSLEAARKSMVLLKNEGSVLPLSKRLKTVAVIGPNADSRRNILGDYTYSAHIDITIMAANAMNAPLPVPEPEMKELPVPVVSILDGIKTKLGKGTKVLYAQGCEYNGMSRDGFAEAVKIAKEADVAIVVAGGKSGLMPDCTCGEMRDSAELRLPGVQEELVKAVYDTATPLVLVLADGRPLVLGWMVEKIPAILEAWLPGEEGGNAVADVLFGDYNPGGKLPIAFPRKAGQVPVYHGHKPSGARSQLWGDYVDCSTTPQFEFGYGLSYTTFKFSNLRIQPEKVKLGSKVRVRVEVENTGAVVGEEVVQLYVNDVVASVTRLVRELKGFKRIALKPGETRTVEFELSTEDLSFYGKDMKRVVEPGEFGVGIGPSSSNIPLLSKFEVIA